MFLHGLFLFLAPPLLVDKLLVGHQQNIIHRRIMIFKGQDAWRSHALFRNLWRKPFPGFGNAVIIYGAYLAIDYAVESAKPKAAKIENH